VAEIVAKEERILAIMAKNRQALAGGKGSATRGQSSTFHNSYAFSGNSG